MGNSGTHGTRVSKFRGPTRENDVRMRRRVERGESASKRDAFQPRRFRTVCARPSAKQMHRAQREAWRGEAGATCGACPPPSPLHALQRTPRIHAPTVAMDLAHAAPAFGAYLLCLAVPVYA